jgi:hypothetical protein
MMPTLLAQNIPFSIVITPDNFPEDISWALGFRNQNAFATGTTSAAGNLPVADYFFTISDSFGDGLCCANGNGRYDLRTNNVNFFTSDGQYGSEETVEFSINADGSATILNGQTPSTPTPTGEYQIDLVPAAGFDSTGLEDIVAALEQAALRWSEVIVGDLPDVGGVDDLEIIYDFSPIDGRGGTIGSAGPTNFRAGSALPFRGQMTFDSADVGNLNSNELEALFLHEMGHVLGLGTLWNFLGISQCDRNNPQGSNANYLGENAVEAFESTPNRAPGSSLLIEQDGGGGTACGHFDEVQLRSEVMTGFLTTNTQTGISELSTITIGSLQDMGYTVNFAAADAFSIPASQFNSEIIMDLDGDSSELDDETVFEGMEDPDDETTMDMMDLDSLMITNYGLYAGIAVGAAAVAGIGGVIVYRKRQTPRESRHVELVDNV